MLSLRIIGGSIVDPAPQEIVQLQRGGRGWCTASIVGPRAVITAAHCAKSGITVKVAEVTQSVSFRKHPAAGGLFNFSNQFDVALGFVASEMPGPYVTLGDIATAPVGTDVALFGYGCWKNGQYDNRLRVGESQISSMQGTDFVTARPAALCYGDSGGPTFNIYTGHQIGVNSKGNISTRSWFLDLTRKDVRDWLADVAQDADLQICGINLDCN